MLGPDCFYLLLLSDRSWRKESSRKFVGAARDLCGNWKRVIERVILKLLRLKNGTEASESQTSCGPLWVSRNRHRRTIRLRKLIRGRKLECVVAFKLQQHITNWIELPSGD
jgi:hypothetical protein